MVLQFGPLAALTQIFVLMTASDFVLISFQGTLT